MPCEPGDRPQFLAHRTHGWAEADRVAWGESNAGVTHAPIASLVDALADVIVPTDERRQVIHGDLSENVLLAPGLAPAVIDFVPYCRPTAFALAIVMVDAVTWHGASPDLLFEEVADVEDIASFLARALVFRLVAADRSLARRPDGRHLAQIQADGHRRAAHALALL